MDRMYFVHDTGDFPFFGWYNDQLPNGMAFLSMVNMALGDKGLTYLHLEDHFNPQNHQFVALVNNNSQSPLEKIGEITFQGRATSRGNVLDTFTAEALLDRETGKEYLKLDKKLEGRYGFFESNAVVGFKVHHARTMFLSEWFMDLTERLVHNNAVDEIEDLTGRQAMNSYPSNMPTSGVVFELRIFYGKGGWLHVVGFVEGFDELLYVGTGGVGEVYHF